MKFSALVLPLALFITSTFVSASDSDTDDEIPSNSKNLRSSLSRLEKHQKNQLKPKSPIKKSSPKKSVTFQKETEEITDFPKKKLDSQHPWKREKRNGQRLVRDDNSNISSSSIKSLKDQKTVEEGQAWLKAVNKQQRSRRSQYRNKR